MDREQLMNRVRCLVRERPDDAEALLVDLIEYAYSHSAVSVSWGQAVVQTPVSVASNRTCASGVSGQGVFAKLGELLGV